MAYPNDQTDAPPLHALNRLQWSRWSRADSNNSPPYRIVSTVGDLELHRESHVCKHRNRDQPEIVDRRAPIHVRTTANFYTHLPRSEWKKRHQGLQDQGNAASGSDIETEGPPFNPTGSEDELG